MEANIPAFMHQFQTRAPREFPGAATSGTRKSIMQ
jgi:hypothetical protein